jgi:hypothetical protein
MAASRKRLKSMADVRRYLAGLINRLEAGEIDPGIASKAGYLSNILIGCIRISDIEARLELLEMEINSNAKTNKYT